MTQPNSKHTDASCKILDCVCTHEYQDKRYGKNLRVHNPYKAKSGKTAYRCTVCGRETE